MDAFNIEERKIHLKHEPREAIWDINGRTYGNFSCLGQETNRAGLLQVSNICWVNLYEYFYSH